MVVGLFWLVVGGGGCWWVVVGRFIIAHIFSIRHNFVITEPHKKVFCGSEDQICSIKTFLKIFSIFTGKHPCQNLFLIKLQADADYLVCTFSCRVHVY